MNNKLEIIKYEDGEINIDVRFDKDKNTIWLTQNDMAILFELDKSSVSRHIKNILKNYSVCAPVVAEYSVTASDGKTYKTKIYNLEIVSEVGERIRSYKIKKFKEWASQQLHPKVQETLENTSLIQFRYDEIVLDVNVSPDEDTVWLTQTQLAQLFETTIPNVSYHINNIYKQKELEERATVKISLIVQNEGGRQISREITYYNLDMIISLGFRINSKNAIIFRKWANKTLKEYLLYGHVINEERCLACTSNIISLQNEMNYIKLKIDNINNELKDVQETLYSSYNKLIFEGEILDAYSFLRKLFFMAKKELIIIDPYADKFLLSMLDDININITIITSLKSSLNKENIKNNINIINYENHGRYIIVDNDIYVIDTSINGIGKHRFVMAKLYGIKKDMLLKDIMEK